MTRSVLVVAVIAVALFAAVGLLVSWDAAFAIVLLGGIGLMLGWRSPMRRPRNAEEALEQDALRAEQDRNRDFGIEGQERIYRNHP